MTEHPQRLRLWHANGGAHQDLLAIWRDLVHIRASRQREHYVAWMKSAYWITATFRPAISVPAGFTTDGLPVGAQIVGRHHADFSVFQLAYAFEQETRFGQRRPPIA